MKVLGPDSKYAMQWKGEWRAVMNMIDAGNYETTLVGRCAKAVLYLTNDEWVATVVFTSSDLVERTDRDPNAREWEYISG